MTIFLKNSALWTGAVFFYIIPIFWFMAGAFIGGSIGGDWGIGETGAAIFLGLSGLAIGLAVTMIIAKSSKFGSKMTPRIIRVVEHGKKENVRIHPGIDASTGASCCS